MKKIIVSFITICCLGTVIFVSYKFYKNKNLEKVTAELRSNNDKKEQLYENDNKEQSTIKKEAPKESESVVENKEIKIDTKEDNVADKLKHKLNIDAQVQKVWYYCAPTTVSMMLASRGVEIDQFALAKEMGTYEPYGTYNKDAIRILNKHLYGYEYPKENQSGYRLQHVTNVEEELPRFKKRLMQNIKDGYPMYYTMDVSKVYSGKKGEHNVIGIGYKLTADEKDIEYLYYYDPSPNVQDKNYGALKIMTPRELLDAMVVCEEPNYAW